MPGRIMGALEHARRNQQRRHQAQPFHFADSILPATFDDHREVTNICRRHFGDSILPGTQRIRRFTNPLGERIILPPIDDRILHLVMYHGTLMGAVKRIRLDGFARSRDGELGPGVYMVEARNIEKAKRFAHDALHRADHADFTEARDRVPVLLKCVAWIEESRILRLQNADCQWRKRGDYEACYAESTNKSKSPEWCFRRPETVRLVSVKSLRSDGCPYCPHPCPYEEKNPTIKSSPWGGSCPCK